MVKIRFKGYTTRDLHFVVRGFKNFLKYIMVTIPKRNLFLPQKEWRKKIIERNCILKRDVKTFSPFQSLLIQRNPYFETLFRNSNKN